MARVGRHSSSVSLNYESASQRSLAMDLEFLDRPDGGPIDSESYSSFQTKRGFRTVYSLAMVNLRYPAYFDSSNNALRTSVNQAAGSPVSRVAIQILQQGIHFRFDQGAVTLGIGVV